jgi:putative heme degradation protein
MGAKRWREVRKRRPRTIDASVEHETARFAATYRAILEALRDLDPEGLIRMGAPEDEYRPEARDLACRVMCGETIDARVVNDVWAHYFGVAEAFGREERPSKTRKINTVIAEAIRDAVGRVE